MDKVNKKSVKQKANFYWQEKLKCHVKKVPIGFLNGLIKSELMNDTFYWFEDLRTPGKEEKVPESITEYKKEVISIK